MVDRSQQDSRIDHTADQVSLEPENPYADLNVSKDEIKPEPEYIHISEDK